MPPLGHRGAAPQFMGQRVRHLHPPTWLCTFPGTTGLLTRRCHLQAPMSCSTACRSTTSTTTRAAGQRAHAPASTTRFNGVNGSTRFSGSRASGSTPRDGARAGHGRHDCGIQRPGFPSNVNMKGVVHPPRQPACGRGADPADFINRGNAVRTSERRLRRAACETHVRRSSRSPAPSSRIKSVGGRALSLASYQRERLRPVACANACRCRTTSMVRRIRVETDGVDTTDLTRRDIPTSAAPTSRGGASAENPRCLGCAPMSSAYKDERVAMEITPLNASAAASCAMPLTPTCSILDLGRKLFKLAGPTATRTCCTP